MTISSLIFTLAEDIPMLTHNHECDSEQCSYYPYYGRAPHQGMFDCDEWPTNFTEDREGLKEDEKSLIPCGTYYCPNCLKGLK